jgi:hypothetical protein
MRSFQEDIARHSLDLASLMSELAKYLNSCNVRVALQRRKIYETTIVRICHV